MTLLRKRIWMALAVPGVFLASCKKKSSETEPPNPAAAAIVRAGSSNAVSTPILTNAAPGLATARPEQLRVQWPVGNRYVYQIVIDQTRTNQLPAAPQPGVEELKLTVSYALNVIEETSGGGREVELEFLSTELQIMVAGESGIHFNTAVTNSADQPVPAPFRKLIGSKALVRLGSDGLVDRILGYDVWLKGVVGEASGPASQLLAQQFNKEFFGQLADFGRGLPGRPVRVFDSWPHRTEMASPEFGKIVMESTITWTGWENREQRRLAVLSASGTLRGEADLAQSQAPAMSFTRGQVTGRSWLDPEARTMVESVVEEAMEIKGTMPGSASTNTAAGAFTSDVQQKVTVKLLQVGKAL